MVAVHVVDEPSADVLRAVAGTDFEGRECAGTSRYVEIATSSLTCRKSDAICVSNGAACRRPAEKD